MRRSLAGVLLLAAGVLLALAASLFWLSRVAFSPSTDTEITQAILRDEQIRGEIAALVAGADAPILNQSPAQLKEYIEQIAAIPAGAAVMADFVSQAHARLIGERSEPVRITGEQQVLIVRDEQVALQPPVTLPVQEVGSVAFVKTLVDWGRPIAAVLGLLALVLGVVLRPERGETTLALGTGLAGLGVLTFLFGYLVPVALLPALSDTTWTGVFARLANHWRVFTVVMALASIVLAGVIVFGTTSLRQRRQWSTPLAVGRYRDDHSWSR